MFNVGDYVVRISYNRDIMFRIVNVLANSTVKLKGVSYRILADAPISDLEMVGSMRSREEDLMNSIDMTIEKILKKRQEMQKHTCFTQKATVLHIDGDAFYLKLCLKYYKLLDIPVIGEHVTESDQPKRIRLLMDKYNPDIVVLTGHDALNKNYKNLHDVTEYRNSAYFIEAVKRIRNMKNSNRDLVIFAGACQSYFEEILEAGADYAASPKRTLIHALDPVFLVEKVINWPFYQVLPVEIALENTITKFDGLGGYEVMGKCRKGGPIVVERTLETPSLDHTIKERLDAPLFSDTLNDFKNKILRKK